MTLKEIAVGFAERHGVEGLDVVDDVFALDVDGVVVTLASSGSMLVASAAIGEPPVEGKAMFADLLLEANLEVDAVFAKSRTTGEYLLLRRLPIADMEASAFDSMLETLVNNVETWRRILSDYRPAVETAAAAEGDVQLGFGQGGFMQV